MNEIINGAITATTFIMIVSLIGATVGFILHKLGFFSDLKTETQSNRRLGRMLAVMLGIAMMVLGIGKLAGFKPQLERFDEYYQMLHLINLVGVTEFSIGLLLLFPKTYKLGVLLLHVSLGGSMVVHFPQFSDGLGAAIGSIWVLVILWFSVVYYAPEMFPDFITRKFNKQSSQLIKNGIN